MTGIAEQYAAATIFLGGEQGSQPCEHCMGREEHTDRCWWWKQEQAYYDRIDAAQKRLRAT